MEKGIGAYNGFSQENLMPSSAGRMCLYTSPFCSEVSIVPLITKSFSTALNMAKHPNGHSAFYQVLSRTTHAVLKDLLMSQPLKPVAAVGVWETFCVVMTRETLSSRWPLCRSRRVASQS